MKSMTIAVVVSILLGIASTSDAQKKFPHGFYLPNSNDELYGIWINAENEGKNSFTYQKHQVTNWGYFENYLKVADEQPSTRGTFIIADKWSDNQGNIWYKRFVQISWYPKGEFHLVKLSKNATVIEWISNTVDWPTKEEMNSEGVLRSIFYKQ
jgi:hypothetical protein